MLGFSLNMGPFGRGEIGVDHAQIVAFDIEESPLGDPVASQIEYQAPSGKLATLRNEIRPQNVVSGSKSNPLTG